MQYYCTVPAHNVTTEPKGYFYFCTVKYIIFQNKSVFAIPLFMSSILYFLEMSEVKFVNV